MTILLRWVSVHERQGHQVNIISPTLARQKAGEAIEKNGIKDWPQGSLLKNPKMEIVQDPFPVAEESDQGGAERIFTYIVPYGIQGERDKNGTPFTRLCILLDGQNGDFEELAVFRKPVAYLTKEGATEVVASALRVDVDKLKVSRAESIFEPCEISQLRAYPFWKVIVKDKNYYVDQDRNLFTQILPSKGGGN
jgi:hypothetical protein